MHIDKHQMNQWHSLGAALCQPTQPNWGPMDKHALA